MQYLEIITLTFLVLLHASQFGANEVDENKVATEIVVDLPNGKIRGSFNGLFYAYESIPYAMPPIDELRFASPLPYTTKWEGIRDATQKPVLCMQWDQFKPGGGEDKLHGVEDCLTLNIYKPYITHNSTLPVLVLIHGGAFMFGSVEDNNHERIMRRKGFIVAKMNYRLGPLGFLSTEDAVIPGNYGLKDQRLALQWIKSNIARFGGDPERMMVLGFSSGGAAVHLQMLREDFSEFAKVAVSFSGTAFNPWVVLRNSRARAFSMAKNLNCPILDNSTEIKRCLQSKSASDIVRGVRNFLIFGYNPFTTFGPVVEPAEVEDAFLTQTPEEIVRSGNFAQIPWLTSYTAQDGGYNAAELLQIRPRRGEMIEAFNERWFDLAPYTLFFKDSMSSIEELDDYSMALKNRYLGDKEFSVDTYLDVQRMYTDILFKNGAEKAVRLHREFAWSPIYAYVYDNPAEEGAGTVLSNRKDIQFGTTHGDDFSLIFPHRARLSALNDDEIIISNKFIKMLEDFIRNNDELVYGNCKFIDNVNKSDLQLMKIMKDTCENLSVQGFP